VISGYVLELYPDFVGEVVALHIYSLIVVPVVDVHVDVFVA
jgi:hypothetical protein